MDIQYAWTKALKQTEIIRFRLQPLHTFQTTHLPYVFLAESSINMGDTVVRKGEVAVDRPQILLPSDSPQLEGFDFHKESKWNQDNLTTFLMVRGVRFPSLKYQNKTESLDIYEGRLQTAIDRYQLEFQREENTGAGLIVGPEDCWQFSLLIFICMQVQRSADGDIRHLMDEHRKKNEE